MLQTLLHTEAGIDAAQPSADTPLVSRAVHRFSQLLRTQHQACMLEIGNRRLHVGTNSPGATLVGCTLRFPAAADFLDFTHRLRLLDAAKLFVEGKLNVQGDIHAAVDVFYSLNDRPATLAEQSIQTIRHALSRIMALASKGKEPTPHYALNPQVYELFLDDYMQYTCGLFRSPDDDLATSQTNKLSFLGEGVELGPDKQHLDIGCGWGGAVRFLVENFRCHAVGITNSQVQADYSRSKLASADCADIVRGDFAEYDRPAEFDSISVVGMLEHIPRHRHAEFFRYLHRTLKPNGRAYIQCITRSPKWVGGDGSRFLERYVFPGFYLEKIDVLLHRIRKAGLSVNDGEVWEHSSHYALTARHWLHRLEQSQGAARASGLSDRQYRILVGYLAVGSKLFAEGRGALHRMFVTKK